MKRVSLLGLSVLLAACAEPTGSAMPDVRGPAMAVTVNPDGTGFVGKGDVQLTFGWNNKQLQDYAESVKFSINSTVVTEVSWTCTNSNNENTQPRARTTTTTTQGLFSSVARVKNQITGFALSGYSGTPSINATTDGNPLNSCPSGPWTLTTPAGDPEEVSNTGGFFVSNDAGATWTPIVTPAS